jgi:hypothetical protein
MIMITINFVYLYVSMKGTSKNRVSNIVNRLPCVVLPRDADNQGRAK